LGINIGPKGKKCNLFVDYFLTARFTVWASDVYYFNNQSVMPLSLL
jgi:hypothetical protein